MYLCATVFPSANILFELKKNIYACIINIQVPHKVKNQCASA